VGSGSKLDIDLEAEVEILKSDFENEQRKVEELQNELAAKNRALEHGQIRLEKKRDENKELRAKIAELQNEN
jgi:chromosome segregation ATPase